MADFHSPADRIKRRPVNGSRPVPPSPKQNMVGEGVDYGNTIRANDAPTLDPGTTYYYRVQAVDDGFNLPHEQSYNTTSALISGWSNTVTLSAVPIIGVAPISLAFGPEDQAVFKSQLAAEC